MILFLHITEGRVHLCIETSVIDNVCDRGLNVLVLCHAEDNKFEKIAITENLNNHNVDI